MSSVITDAAAIQQVLLEWSATSKLQQAVISSDGATITLSENETVINTLDAHTKLTIANESSGRSCEYSAASIFLQIRNPAQSLVAYRNDCKLYAVTDVIKTLDKAFVVSFFVKSEAAAAEGASDTAAAATGTSATNATSESVSATDGTAGATVGDTSKKPPKPTESAEDRKKRKEREHREREKRHRDGSSKHKKSSSQGDDHSPRKKSRSDGAVASMLTNEQLFEGLNVVVDKRSAAGSGSGIGGGGLTGTDHEMDALAKAITAALSAKGYEITDATAPQIVGPFRQRTAAIVSQETPVGNSASILRANNPRKDLVRVLELYNETVKSKDGRTSGGTSESRSASHKQSHSGSSSKQATSGTVKNFRPYLIGKKPVIVVPKGMTAPITLANAHEFLSNARFVPRGEMLKQQQLKGGGTPTTFTRTVRTSSSSPSATGLLEYEIIDNPRKLGGDVKEWERIVAVIVHGQSWQFKDWISKPVAYNVAATLFDRVYGFFVSMEGDKLPADVATWAVERAQINRDKRGLDSITHSAFWHGLDEWMKVYKAELLPQTES